MSCAANTGSYHTWQLSSTSKHQHKRTSDTDVFGTRTGDSNLVFLEENLPELGEDILNALSIEEQTSTCFDRLDAVLTASGLDLTNVMKVELQLTDPAHKTVVDDVYRDRFDGSSPPRT